jgi:hypothetical protein
MISTETFYGVFEAYNTTWLPVLLLFWLALIICTYLLFAKPGDKTNALIKACLAFIFAWNGAVFFFAYMKDTAVPGGIPMLTVGILFAVDAYRGCPTITRQSIDNIPRAHIKTNSSSQHIDTL